MSLCDYCGGVSAHCCWWRAYGDGRAGRTPVPAGARAAPLQLDALRDFLRRWYAGHGSDRCPCGDCDKLRSFLEGDAPL